jgi:hypothetical protein
MMSVLQRTAAAAVLLSTAGLASAQVSPYTFSLSQTITHDSNVFRAPAASARSDTQITTGLSAAVNETIGRQRVRGNLGVQVVRFGDAKTLNHVVPSAGLTWNWETAERLQGDVGFNHVQQLYREGTSNAVAAQGKNVERTTDAFARVRLGVVTQWTLEGGVAAARRDYTLAAFAAQALRRQSVDAGVRYQPQPDLSLRALVRRSTGKYPTYSTTLGADDFDRTDLEGQVNLRLSGATVVDARLARSRESHSQAALRSSSLWSGGAGVQWQPTGKLALTARLTRDTDAGNQEFLSGAASSDSRLSTRVDLGARWAATDKISVGLTWQDTRRDLQNTLSGTQLAADDEARTLSLNASYQLMRTLGLGCAFSDQRREVSGSTLLSYPYTARTLGCFAQLTLN